MISVEVETLFRGFCKKTGLNFQDNRIEIEHLVNDLPGDRFVEGYEEGCIEGTKNVNDEQYKEGRDSVFDEIYDLR
jgi:hypothetical protein